MNKGSTRMSYLPLSYAIHATDSFGDSAVKCMAIYSSGSRGVEVADTNFVDAPDPSSVEVACSDHAVEVSLSRAADDVSYVSNVANAPLPHLPALQEVVVSSDAAVRHTAVEASGSERVVVDDGQQFAGHLASSSSPTSCLTATSPSQALPWAGRTCQPIAASSSTSTSCLTATSPSLALLWPVALASLRL